MMQRIVLVAALLILAACDSRPKETASLGKESTSWDVITASNDVAHVKNNFLIFMR